MGAGKWSQIEGSWEGDVPLEGMQLAAALPQPPLLAVLLLEQGRRQ